MRSGRFCEEICARCGGEVGVVHHPRTRFSLCMSEGARKYERLKVAIDDPR